MGRLVLAAGAVVWALGAIGALLLALAAIEWLQAVLPPLAIDRDALRATVLAVAAGMGTGAVVHVAVLLGLRAGRPRFSSAAILLTALLGAAFVALAAAAYASAAAEPESTWILLAGGVAASVMAVSYIVATVALIAEHRARLAS